MRFREVKELGVEMPKLNFHEDLLGLQERLEGIKSLIGCQEKADGVDVPALLLGAPTKITTDASQVPLMAARDRIQDEPLRKAMTPSGESRIPLASTTSRKMRS